MKPAIDVAPGIGLRVDLDRYHPVRILPSGTEIWDRQYQSVIRDWSPALLGRFLPFVVMSENAERSALFLLNDENGQEVASQSRPLGRFFIPYGEFAELDRRYRLLKSRANAPEVDEDKRKVIRALHFPDPRTESWAYRLYGSRWRPRLLVVWGCEPNLTPDARPVNSGKTIEEFTGSRRWFELDWIKAALACLTVALVLLALCKIFEWPICSTVGKFVETTASQITNFNHDSTRIVQKPEDSTPGGQATTAPNGSSPSGGSDVPSREQQPPGGQATTAPNGSTPYGGSDVPSREQQPGQQAPGGQASTAPSTNSRAGLAVAPRGQQPPGGQPSTRPSGGTNQSAGAGSNPPSGSGIASRGRQAPGGQASTAPSTNSRAGPAVAPRGQQPPGGQPSTRPSGGTNQSAGAGNNPPSGSGIASRGQQPSGGQPSTAPGGGTSSPASSGVAPRGQQPRGGQPSTRPSGGTNQSAGAGSNPPSGSGIASRGQQAPGGQASTAPSTNSRAGPAVAPRGQQPPGGQPSTRPSGGTNQSAGAGSNPPSGSGIVPRGQQPSGGQPSTAPGGGTSPSRDLGLAARGQEPTGGQQPGGTQSSTGPNGTNGPSTGQGQPSGNIGPQSRAAVEPRVPPSLIYRPVVVAQHYENGKVHVRLKAVLTPGSSGPMPFVYWRIVGNQIIIVKQGQEVDFSVPAQARPYQLQFTTRNKAKPDVYNAKPDVYNLSVSVMPDVHIQ